jgi:hypothetical protein
MIVFQIPPRVSAYDLKFESFSLRPMQSNATHNSPEVNHVSSSSSRKGMRIFKKLADVCREAAIPPNRSNAHCTALRSGRPQRSKTTNAGDGGGVMSEAEGFDVIKNFFFEKMYYHVVIAVYAALSFLFIGGTIVRLICYECRKSDFLETSPQHRRMYSI